MSSQVSTGQVRTGEVRSGHFMSWGQVRSGQVRLSQVRPDQVRSSQVRSGQDMSGQVMSVPWVHIYIFYLEPMTPLKQFLPGFRFILGFLISILASFCRFSSISFKLLGTWWHWITICALLGHCVQELLFPAPVYSLIDPLYSM